MGQGKIWDFTKKVGLDSQKCQVQTSIIWVWVGLEVWGIGYIISGAG